MSKPFLGTVSILKEAYPLIESLKFTGTEFGDLRGGDEQAQVYYSETSIPETIPCGNPKCQQGGYTLRATLITVTHNRKLIYEGTLPCNWYEGTPKGRRKGNLCCNSLKYKLEIKYVET